jgi:hypothetical protein
VFVALCGNLLAFQLLTPVQAQSLTGPELSEEMRTEEPGSILVCVEDGDLKEGL